MKALSVRQPWATLIVAGLKRVETRTWATRHRGPLLIHAAKTPDPILRDPPRALRVALCMADVDDGREGALGTEPLVYGALIGEVHVLDCIPAPDVARNPDWWRRYWFTRLLAHQWEMGYGDYGPGRHAWVLTNPRRARVPVPFRGRPGLFEAKEIELA